MDRKPISAKTRFLILARDGYACQCCGAKAPNATLHVDHVVPVSRGGSSNEDNLRTLCVTCNFGKSDIDTTVIPIRGAAVTIHRMPNLPDVRCRGEALSEPILWLGLQWAVTSYGVEARDGTYVIEADRLWENENDYGWLKHMREKDWVDVQDFRAALEFARGYFVNKRKSHAQ